MGLETILEWKMTYEEAETFKVALIYEEEYRKIFGDEIDGQSFRRNRLPLRSDPRKSYLFRNCWRFRRETRGLIESQEYRNYIKANFLIIKINKGRIEPNCITGDRAWLRYKVWKRKYDIHLSEIGAQAPPPSVNTTDPKIIFEIDRTKKFLFEKCEGQPTFEKLKYFIDNEFFRLWVATGKVSPYYITLSPYIAKACDINQLFSVCTSSLGVIQERITQEVRNYFIHEFSYELQ